MTHLLHESNHRRVTTLDENVPESFSRMMAMDVKLTPGNVRLVELPDSVVGLLPAVGGSKRRRRGQRAGAETIDMTVNFVVRNPGGRQLAELPIVFRSRTRSGPTVTLKGQDSSQSLEVDLVLSESTRTLNISMNLVEDARALPSALLPTFKVLHLLVSPNRLSLSHGDIPLLTDQSVPNKESIIPEQLVEAVDLLEYVQRLTDDYFFMPTEFTAGELSKLRRAVQLLDGRRVRGTWNRISVGLEVPQEASAPEVAGEEFAFMAADEETITIAGHEVSLGTAYRHLLAARVVDWQATAERAGTLTLEPGSTNEFEIWLSLDGEQPKVVPGISTEFQELLDEFMEENDEVLRRLAQ